MKKSHLKQNLAHVLASLSYKLQLDKIYIETFIKTLEVIVKILDVHQDLVPQINIDSYHKISLEFGIRDKNVYIHIYDDGYYVTRYDHKDGYKQNLELNKELFKWLWS